MKLEFGGHNFEFEGDELTVMFPLSYRDKHLVVSISMTTIEDDEMLGHFSCGDIINESSRLMACADCDTSPSYKIEMEIAIVSGENNDKVEMGMCTAVSCQEHAVMEMLQVLFMSGLITAYQLKFDEDE